MFEHKGLISPKELLHEQYTDFDILREKPIVFKSADKYIVCAPVLWKEHPEFITDLGDMLSRYIEIFQNVEFLSLTAIKEKGSIEKLVSHVRLFQSTKNYKKFVKKGMPRFIQKWAYTIDGVNTDKPRYIKITKRNSRKIFNAFCIDEMIEILFTLYCFNYDLVKENTWDFIQRLSVSGSEQVQQKSSASLMRKECQMPKYSEQPYPESILKLFEKQSTGKMM